MVSQVEYGNSNENSNISHGSNGSKGNINATNRYITHRINSIITINSTWKWNEVILPRLGMSVVPTGRYV